MRCEAGVSCSTWKARCVKELNHAPPHRFKTPEGKEFNLNENNSPLHLYDKIIPMNNEQIKIAAESEAANKESRAFNLGAFSRDAVEAFARIQHRKIKWLERENNSLKDVLNSHGEWWCENCQCPIDEEFDACPRCKFVWQK